MSEQDTIYALSSGALPSGVAIVRISGSRTRFALETLCGAVPEPRYAALKTIRDRNDLIIDHALVLFFPNPKSFTGEDCAEIHFHGGRAVISACFQTLRQINGLRMADAGEFTKRAFDNGKIDLTEAEGLADLISAETEMQRRLALQQSHGVLKTLYEGWSARILRSRALIEAELDFSDEDDIPGSVSYQVWSVVSDLCQEIEDHLNRSHSGEMVRTGFSVVIAGAPNAGKSSLLNVLAGREVAIVSDELGTTRDVLEVRLDLDGHLVLIKDTAGLRKTDSKVEQEGIRRAERELENADLVLHLIDTSSENTEQKLDVSRDKLVTVGTKSDLVDQIDSKTDILLSTKTMSGIDQLLDIMKNRVSQSVPQDEYVVPTRQRHKDLVSKALQELAQARDLADLPIEIRSEHLRLSQEYLGRVTGRTNVEDLLGVIFSEFCVGK